jgi:hypothetical protein
MRSSFSARPEHRSSKARGSTSKPSPNRMGFCVPVKLVPPKMHPLRLARVLTFYTIRRIRGTSAMESCV